MEVSNILAAIDAEIVKLQQARALLAGTGTALKTGRGRPKGSKNAVAAAIVSAKAGKAPAKAAPKAKRQLSPEGRKAIADAMKRRWAERRKQVAKAAVAK